MSTTSLESVVGLIAVVPQNEGFSGAVLVLLFLCKQAGWLGQATNDLISNSSGGAGLTFSSCCS